MNLKSIGLIVLSSIIIMSCVYHELPFDGDCELEGPSLTIADSSQASKCGVPDGTITVSVTGGKEPYLFSINGGEQQSSPIFSNITSNLYSVTVTDKNGCTAQIENILIGVEDFDAHFDIQPDDQCLTGGGSVTITVNETDGPYQFSFDEAGFTTDSTIAGLKHGEHLVEIQDNEGCNVKMKFTIPRGETGVSWENEILPIITQYCATANCHNGVSLPNDWRNYDKVKQYAATIKKKTGDKSMPFDGPMPQDKIDLIACWVDDGALKN